MRAEETGFVVAVVVVVTAAASHVHVEMSDLTPLLLLPPLPCRSRAAPSMQHYGVNGYSLHAMNSLSAMYNLHQQAAQQAQHAPDYRPSVHALTLAERLAGN